MFGGGRQCCCVSVNVCLLNPHADECRCSGQRSDHHINDPFASNHRLVNRGIKSIPPTSHFIAVIGFKLIFPEQTNSHTP